MQHLPECQLILKKLENELPPKLYYHSIYHTLDVYNCAASIAKEEGVTDSDLKLLLVGAIYHDAGYLIQNEDHEQHSCAMAREYLTQFNYAKIDIDRICGVIMATKIPQSPKCHLEEIICDADLNYLGRTDFFNIGENLYKEMIAMGYIKDREEWNKLQVDFLQKHHYFTATAIRHNYAQKEENLAMVQSKIK